jgi:integrase
LWENLWVLAEEFGAVAAKLTGAKGEAKLEAGIKDRPPGRHGFGDGLWLEVAGGRSWCFRFMKHGKARQMGLGSWPVVSLSAARDKVAEARALLEAGKDPIDARRDRKTKQTLEQARRITFDTAIERYIAANEVQWRNAKHRAQWRATLKTYAAPVLGKVSVADVTTDHVLRVLRPIWTTKPETAVRVRGRIEAVLASAIAQGWCPEPNVARWHNHLQMVLPPRSKVAPVTPHAALDWRDLPAFMAKLREHDSFGAWALELVILTACRSGEARGAVWSEIDLDKALWTIPAQRMKANRAHVVPLSPPAVALLRKAGELRGTGDFVFQGIKPDKPLSDMSLLAVLKRIGRADITTHGFRACFKTWASDKTDHPREVIEAALAHTVGDKAEQAYQRGSWLERRRKLMDEWRGYCERQYGEIVSFRPAV